MSGHDMWRLQKATSHGQGIKVRGVALVGRLEMGLWSFNQQQHLGPFPAEPLFRSVGTLNCDWRWPGRQRDKVRCHLYQYNILERYLAHHQQRHLSILPVVLCEACSLVQTQRSRVVLFIFRGYLANRHDYIITYVEFVNQKRKYNIHPCPDQLPKIQLYPNLLKLTFRQALIHHLQ